MSVFISICFLLQVLTEGFGQVYSGLVGQTDKDPQYVCHSSARLSFSPCLKDWSPYLRAITRASSPTSSVRTVILVSSLK